MANIHRSFMRNSYWSIFQQWQTFLGHSWVISIYLSTMANIFGHSWVISICLYFYNGKHSLVIPSIYLSTMANISAICAICRRCFPSRWEGNGEMKDKLSDLCSFIFSPKQWDVFCRWWFDYVIKTNSNRRLEIATESVVFRAISKINTFQLFSLSLSPQLFDHA